MKNSWCSLYDVLIIHCFECIVAEPVMFKQIFFKLLAKNLFRPGSGSSTEFGIIQNLDPDPVKNRPDPQF
jgi:hypothetical protein